MYILSQVEGLENQPGVNEEEEKKEKNSFI